MTLRAAVHRAREAIKQHLLARRRLGASSDSWKDPSVPEAQRLQVEDELRLMREGGPPSVFTVAAEALKAIPGEGHLRLLDAGCASGYYYEVISQLVGDRFEYSGSDYSDSMLALARSKYPDVQFRQLDICDVDLPDGAYDVVFSGAVVVHVLDWKRAISELARVSASHLVLHRTPVTANRTYRIEKRGVTGTPAYHTTFNKDELLTHLSSLRFTTVFEKNVYPSQPKGVGIVTYTLARAAETQKSQGVLARSPPFAASSVTRAS